MKLVCLPNLWFLFVAVDIWSAGCIMAEMLLGKPLFKGNDRILYCVQHWHEFVCRLHQTCFLHSTYIALFKVTLIEDESKPLFLEKMKLPQASFGVCFQFVSRCLSSSALRILHLVLYCFRRNSWRGWFLTLETARSRPAQRNHENNRNPDCWFCCEAAEPRCK